MITIAICDDNERACYDIEIKIKKYASDKHYDITCVCFLNAFELLDNNPFFDIYLLDILMPGLNGIEVAKTLRKNGANTEIIFLTSSPEFALESYSVQALNYLLKPVDKNQLFDSLDRAIAALDHQNQHYLVIRSAGRLLSISFQDVEFVESIMDKVYFHMTDGVSYKTIGSLSTFEAKLLCDPRFVKSHRAYIVNMSKIKELKGHDIYVFSHYPPIPIARGRFAQVKEAYLAYMTFQMNRGESK